MWLIASGAGALDDARDGSTAGPAARLSGHGRGDVKILEGAGPALELGLHFQDDAVLVGCVKIVETRRCPNAL